MRGQWGTFTEREREFFIDNQLVRIHVIIVMIRWTGLAPWEFGNPFPGSLTSTFITLREIAGGYIHIRRERAGGGIGSKERTNLAHIRQSRPDSGLCIQVKALKTY